VIDEIKGALEELKNKLQKKKIEELNKETLLKIIELIEKTSENKIYEIIEKIINDNFKEKKKIENDFILLRIKSILTDIKKKKYEKKISYENYTIYYYKTHIDIFKEIECEYETIVEEIKKLEKSKNLSIFIGNKNILFSEKIISKEVEETLKNNSNFNIKIRVNI